MPLAGIGHSYNSLAGCILGYVVLYLSEPSFPVVAKGHISVLWAFYPPVLCKHTDHEQFSRVGVHCSLRGPLARPFCSTVECCLRVQSVVGSSGGAFMEVTLGLVPWSALSEGEVGVGAAVIAMVVASGLATAVPSLGSSAFSEVLPS